MDQLKKLFDGKAESFRQGRMEEVGKTFKTPTGLYVDDTLLPVMDLKQNIQILETYHAKLLELGYDKTEYEISYYEELGPEKAKAKVHWKQMNAESQIIASLCVVHFCSEVNGEWQEDMAELVLEESSLVTSIVPSVMNIDDQTKN